MRKALTIGELLITMSVIGIIAVLIMPSFLESYDNKVYVTKLKKAVGMIENAVTQSCADNHVSYFYQTKHGIHSNNALSQKKFLNAYFKVASTTNKFGKYRTLDGTGSAIAQAADRADVELASGEMLGMTCPDKEDYCIFLIDTNSTKKPNIFGRDFFEIWLDKKTNKLYDGYKDAAVKCRGTANAHGCYQRILDDNWEMKY